MKFLQIIIGSILCLFFYMPFGICIANPGSSNEALIAYYSMDSQSITNTVLEDLSSNNYDGINFHAQFLNKGIKGDGSMFYNGTNAYTDLGQMDIPGESLTITAWIYVYDFNVHDARIISKASGTDEQEHYWMLSTIENKGYKLRFRLKTDGITSTLIASEGNLETKQWTHVAAVYDGIEMKLYKDAILVASTPKMGVIDTNHTIPTWIGNNPSADRPFNGLIDELKIYNKSFTHEEITTFYNDDIKNSPDPSDSVNNPNFGSQSSTAYLEWDFDFVETFDNLANWVNHDGRVGNVTDISKMPKLSDGSDSAWGYYSMWSDHVQTQDWISNYGDNRVWRGEKSACIDFEGNGGPSRLGLYFGNSSNEYPENTGYDDIYIFYMVNIRANNWPTDIDENKVGTYTPGESYDWISSWKFNTLNMGGIAPHKYISTTDDRYSTYHIVPHLKPDNYTQDGQIIVINALRDGEQEIFPARGKSVDEYLNNWWGVEFHFRNVMEGDEQVTYQDIWIYGPDGQASQALTHARIVFESQSISNKWNEFYFGGNNSNTYTYGPTMQGDYYVDDFIIDDQRIGPKYFRIIKNETPEKKEKDLIYADNLKYLGAFKLPQEYSNGYQWEYGGYALAFRPDGNPEGSLDGYSGSLFSAGAKTQAASTIKMISEFSIPEPIISDNAEDLNTATTLQAYGDITDGYFDEVLSGEQLTVIKGLTFLEAQNNQIQDKLYWSFWSEYNVANENHPSIGYSDLDLQNPNAQGVWNYENYHVKSVGGYLFDIPRDWADQHISGIYIAAGITRVGDSSVNSFGPALIASAPYLYSNSNPPDANKLPNTALIHYTEDHKLPGYKTTDTWRGGSWITAKTKEAVVFVGQKATGNTWYGLPDAGDGHGENPCGAYKGYHADAFESQMLFYNPDDLAMVANDMMAAWEPIPYLTLDLSTIIPLFSECSRIEGASYDRANKLLYLIHYQGNFPRPLVHVIQMMDEMNGDMNKNSKIDIADAILAMQLIGNGSNGKDDISLEKVIVIFKCLCMFK